MTREQTCCFTGHRPGKLPWGFDEADPRCLALKGAIARELEGLYRQGFRHFLSGMAQGCDLYFAQAVLDLRARRPDVTLECALPFAGQAQRWREADRARWQSILDACDVETVVQEHYDRFCMHRRDRYLVDRARGVLAAFDGTPGGTMYTLNYAMDQGLVILLLDLNHPEKAAVHLTL